MRFFLGLTFIYAGLDKIADPGFLDPAGGGAYLGNQLQNFVARSPIGFLIQSLALPQVELAGVGVIATELLVGVLVLLGVLTRPAVAVRALFRVDQDERDRQSMLSANELMPVSRVRQLVAVDERHVDSIPCPHPARTSVSISVPDFISNTMFPVLAAKQLRFVEEVLGKVALCRSYPRWGSAQNIAPDALGRSRGLPELGTLESA
jgi:hypothetical protein